MPCEQYQIALTDAAATAVLPSALREHLANCAACRASFATEQNLFASIDTGLSVAANAELPPAFLSRFQARIKEEKHAPEKYSWIPTWAFAAVSAAAILLATSFPFMKSKPRPQTPTVTPSFSGAEIPAHPATPQNVQHAAEAAPEHNLRNSSASSGHHAAIKQNNLPGSVTAASIHRAEVPEVIIPPGEAQAFARFVATIGQNRQLDAATLYSTARNDGPLQMNEIQIAAVHVEPLNPETEPTDFLGRTHEAQ